MIETYEAKLARLWLEHVIMDDVLRPICEVLDFSRDWDVVLLGVVILMGCGRLAFGVEL